MRLLPIYLFFVIFISSNFFCKKTDTITEKYDIRKDTTINSELSKYNFISEESVVIKLPGELQEISGLMMTDDGRLFGHNDEKGFVYQIDYSNGNIIKKFSLGEKYEREDFEGIAYANKKFYMVTSNGDLYEFVEGSDGESVSFNIYKTDLTSKNDVEGLCFDPETNSLLLACKGYPGKDFKKQKAVYLFSLDRMELEKEPRFLIDLSEIKQTFNPSGIERNPNTGTFFIIAANGNAILEISGHGELIDITTLPPIIHEQPEGITFAPDKSLIISNEGDFKRGSLVLHKHQQ
ncbi:MAG: SdiA-regulated domain-containing protein [Ignavibacteria bacterium]|nr:SdiA-regulated domain-containing protein [Ignavibacteria bacterium]